VTLTTHPMAVAGQLLQNISRKFFLPEVTLKCPNLLITYVKWLCSRVYWLFLLV
jgi:hypothetical protein